MEEFLDEMRTSFAVYWPPAGTDRFGQQKFGDATEIRVRWEQVTETFLNQANQEQTSKAKVWFGEADGVVEKGVLWEGRLADLPGDPAKPFSSPGAWAVARVDKTPPIDWDPDSGEPRACIAYL